MAATVVERAATIDGQAVRIVVSWDEDYVVRVLTASGQPIALLEPVPGPYFPAEVARLQRVALDAARAALPGSGRSLQAIADEMQGNGELATARSLHRSLRRRR